MPIIIELGGDIDDVDELMGILKIGKAALIGGGGPGIIEASEIGSRRSVLIPVDECSLDTKILPANAAKKTFESVVIGMFGDTVIIGGLVELFVE